MGTILTHKQIWKRRYVSALADERGLGLWITENSRKSDKKGLVLEQQPHSEIKIGLTFVSSIVLSQSYLAAMAEDFWKPPSACCETASVGHGVVCHWTQKSHLFKMAFNYDLGLLAQEKRTYWNSNFLLVQTKSGTVKHNSQENWGSSTDGSHMVTIPFSQPWGDLKAQIPFWGFSA
jgi:hypothetical protein